MLLAAMNLEMPGPNEVGHLRIMLLIVLGVIIITIPVIMLMLLAKLKARPRVRPGGAVGEGTKTTEGTEGTKEPQALRDGSPDILSGSNPGQTTSGSGNTSIGNTKDIASPEAGPPNA
jgi:hypothetical protein